MALPASGALSIHDIITEKGGTPTPGGNYSLIALSTTSINAESTFKPDGIAPHGISEFYQYDHDEVDPEETTTTTTDPETTTTTTDGPPETTTTSTTTTTTSTTTTTVITYESIGTWGRGSESGSSPGDACPPNIAQDAVELFVVTGTPVQNGTTVYTFSGTYLPFNGSGDYWGEVLFTDDVPTFIINGSGQLSGEYTC